MTDGIQQAEVNSTGKLIVEIPRKIHGSSRLDEKIPSVLESASSSMHSKSYGHSSTDWNLVLKKGKPK